jgi:hypothetical protein
MGRPASKTDVVNIAATYIGESRVNSIDPATTEREQLFALLYDQVRLDTLREHPWNFASDRALCPRMGTDPAFGFSAQYAIPADFVRLNRVGYDTGSIQYEPATWYALEGRKILIDSSANSIPILYVKDFETVAAFDPKFTDVFALRLALQMARATTKSAKVVEEVNSLLTLALATALSIDGQESPPQRIERSRYLDARRYMQGRTSENHRWTFD